VLRRGRVEEKKLCSGTVRVSGLTDPRSVTRKGGIMRRSLLLGRNGRKVRLALVARRLRKNVLTPEESGEGLLSSKPLLKREGSRKLRTDVTQTGNSPRSSTNDGAINHKEGIKERESLCLRVVSFYVSRGEGETREGSRDIQGLMLLTGGEKPSAGFFQPGRPTTSRGRQLTPGSREPTHFPK